MRAHLLSLGTELVTGHVLDTNAAWLARRLSEAGVEVIGHTTLPDEREAAGEALRRAAATSDVVVVTGGLGPTADDLTRFVLAEAMGVELVTDAAVLEHIRRFFAVRHRRMPPANEVQAMVPAGAAAIENPCGTAPGIHARVGCAEVYALPGVPLEMQRMCEQHVLPHLAAASGGGAIASAALHTFGTTESDVGEKIRDLMARGRNPDVGTTTRRGVITIRIHARAASPDGARKLVEADAAEVAARLGRHVFGRDEETLAVVVGRRLAARGETLSTAESCTGGLVAKLLTDVPGASAYLVEGVVTYANDAKTRLLGVPPELLAAHGAVSREVAAAMAAGCRARSGTHYALGLTGLAGPTGGTEAKPVGLVYVALDAAQGSTVRELRLGRQMPRAEIRHRAANSALNLLRLKLLQK